MTQMMATESTEEHGKNLNDSIDLAALYRAGSQKGISRATPVPVINRLEGC
jgi:hypothetical protein